MLASQLTTPELIDDILSLRVGDHLCLFYDDDPAAQMPALLPYMSQGLRDGERVVYVADDILPDELRRRMSDYGIDVGDAEIRGALQIWTTSDWRLPGILDREAKAAQFAAVITEAIEAGFTGVRFAIEMTWTLGPEVDAADLHAWERRLSEVVVSGPVRMICQYNRRRLAPGAIESALATHPLAVMGEQVVANAFYQPSVYSPSRSLEAAEETADRVEWMLAQLRWVRRYEAERERRLEAERAAEVANADRERLQELYRVANNMAESLAQANALKDEFLGLVSHELRTPLTIILGNAEILHSATTLDDEERQQSIEDIRVESHRLNRLITNLLSLAKLGADSTHQMQAVKVGPIAQRVVAQHRRIYRQRPIMLEGAGEPVPCMGIEVLIEQVIGNLISNAEKYSKPDKPIEVGMRDGHGWRIVTVKDRGIGLDPHEVNKAFEAFYRSDRASTVGPGLGIGLTVCKRLIEAQGGRIWARSREGGGSVFTFILRLAQ